MDERPLWKMPRFSKVEAAVDTFRTQAARRQAFSTNELDAVPRQGANVFQQGIYNVQTNTMPVWMSPTTLHHTTSHQPSRVQSNQPTLHYTFNIIFINHINFTPQKKLPSTHQPSIHSLVQKRRREREWTRRWKVDERRNKHKQIKQKSENRKQHVNYKTMNMSSHD